MTLIDDAGLNFSITAKRKWLTVVLVPALIALMLWGGREVIINNLTTKGDQLLWITQANQQLWRTLVVLFVLAVMLLLFAWSIVWVFCARVTLYDDRIIARGIILTREINTEQMEGYRYINEDLHLYQFDREWPLQLSYFNGQEFITQWLFNRTKNLDLQELQQEDEVISKDLSLGMTEQQKEERLHSLRTLVRNLNCLGYLAILIAVPNFLFFEHVLVTKLSTVVLILVPILLDIIGLANRGHVRVSYKEGTRYPEIFTATWSCGIALGVLSILDHGALIGNQYINIFVAITLAKVLFWLFVDPEGIGKDLKVGGLIIIFPIIGLFVSSGIWASGALYQLNKQFDSSTTHWYESVIVSKKSSKGRIVNYRINVQPWDSSTTKPIKIKLSNQQFQLLSEQQRIEVGVRQGFLKIPWVIAVRAKKEE